MKDAVKELYTRQSLEKERYGQLYGVNYYDLDNYDLVIDSTNATPAQIAEEIIRRFEQFEAGDKTKHMEISPYRIYPVVPVQELDDLKVEKYSSDCEDEVCFDETLEVILKDGKWYAGAENEKLLAAQADKKSFICVRIKKDGEGRSTEDICSGYEEKAGFKYAGYPEEILSYSNEAMYW